MYSDHGGGHSSSLWHLFSFISVVKKNKTKKIRTKELESRAPPPPAAAMVIEMCWMGLF